MCGRFSLITDMGDIRQYFHWEESLLHLEPRFNIAPTQSIAAVRMAAGGGRSLGLFHWGLIPSWSKDPSIGARMINARGETVEEKPSFRAAFRKRRCLVLAGGFYEWQKLGGKKQPFHIHRRDRAPFAFAGLWEVWRDPTSNSELESCAIITTGPNALMHPIHDRMLVILELRDFDTWMSPATEAQRLKSLLVPCEGDSWEAVPVTTHVNNPKHDDARCLEPAGTI